MSMFRATVLVTLRKSILDPQGKAVHHALENLGLRGVRDVRMGKLVELELELPTAEEAEQAIRKACTTLLANPVMEEYSISVKEA